MSFVTPRNYLSESYNTRKLKNDIHKSAECNSRSLGKSKVELKNDINLQC